MIFWMPKSQDGLDKWSWVHLIGGCLIGGISAIWLRPAYAILLTAIFAFLYECRDAWYANKPTAKWADHRLILSRRVGARYSSSKLYRLIFWMADKRGASVWDLRITIGGGFVCAPLSHYLFAWLSRLLRA